MTGGKWAEKPALSESPQHQGFSKLAG